MPGFLSPYDKVIHFLMYGVFATLLAREAMPQMGAWRGAVIAAALAAAFAAADEWHQGFVPGRDRDVQDWKADTAGAVVGVLTAAMLRRARFSPTS